MRWSRIAFTASLSDLRSISAVAICTLAFFKLLRKFNYLLNQMLDTPSDDLIIVAAAQNIPVIVSIRIARIGGNLLLMFFELNT
jgi:hypothetical protein